MDKHFHNPFTPANNPFTPANNPFTGKSPFGKPAFGKPPSGGLTPAGAPHPTGAEPSKHPRPKPPPTKHPPPKQKPGPSQPANKSTPKEKPRKKRPPSKKKTAGKAKQQCFNWRESLAKNAASAALEKGAHIAAHKNQKKVNKQNRFRKNSNFKAVARGKGPYSQLAKGMIKDGNKKVATAAKVTKGVRRGGGGVAGIVVETGYQLHKTGGKLTPNSAVEIGAAGAVGVATTGVMAAGAAVATATGVAAAAAALPAVVVAGAVIATSVGVAVALDYGLEKSGAKTAIKNRMGIPKADQD